MGSKTTEPAVNSTEGYQEEPDPRLAVAVVGSAANVAGTASAGKKKEANEVEMTDNAKVEYYAFHQGNIRRASETG